MQTRLLCAELRYAMVWINKRRKDNGQGGSRVSYHFLPHGIVLWHPSFVFSGYGIDEAMIVDDFR